MALRHDYVNASRATLMTTIALTLSKNAQRNEHLKEGVMMEVQNGNLSHRGKFQNVQDLLIYQI